MESPKKFHVPQIDDDDIFEINNVPKYFKSGNIIKEIKADNLELSQSKKDLNDASSSSLSSNVQITEVKEPATKFENAFSNLRASKFFDKNVESEISVSEDGQNKLIDKSRAPNALLVNARQRGNPLLKHIRNVPWEFAEIEPDYVMGKTACALFLSLKYHNLFPNYIHERLKALGKSYELRVLLVQVDVVEPTAPLKDLSVISILADCTLMVSWSAEEAGNYLETYKMYENKSADLIKERQDNDNFSQLIDCLTTIRSINKTDAVVLLSTFKTLKGIIQASVTELSICPGIGPLKAKRLYDALRRPIKNEPKGNKHRVLNKVP